MRGKKTLFYEIDLAASLTKLKDMALDAAWGRHLKG